MKLKSQEQVQESEWKVLSLRGNRFEPLTHRHFNLFFNSQSVTVKLKVFQLYEARHFNMMQVHLQKETEIKPFFTLLPKVLILPATFPVTLIRFIIVLLQAKQKRKSYLKSPILLCMCLSKVCILKNSLVETYTA